MYEIDMYCPYCSQKNTLTNNNLKCSNKSCLYQFKVFIREEGAHKFHDIQKSILPRHINEVGKYWIVSYCFYEVRRPSINKLTELIDKETLNSVLRGFVHILKAPLYVYERKDSDSVYQTDSAYNIEEFYEVFCRKIQKEERGKILCLSCTKKRVEEMFNGNNKDAEYQHCLFGVGIKLVPIVINSFLYGLLLMCGGCKKNNDEKDLISINDGFEYAKREMGINYSLINIVNHEENEIGKQNAEIDSIKKQLEDLGSNSYKRKRYERDDDFIREIDAWFATPSIKTEEVLWERLNRILERLARFCDFGACLLFMSESEKSEKIYLKSRYPLKLLNREDFINPDEAVLDFFKRKKSYFTRKPEETRSIYEFIKNDYKDEIKVMGVFTLDLHPERGFLVIVNRQFGLSNNVVSSSSVSDTTKEFILRFAGYLVTNIRNHLSLIKLKKSEKERQEMVTITVHTFNHYIDGILADSCLLERLTTKYNEVPTEKVIRTSKRIAERVLSLATKTKLFYYSTVINAGKDIDFRFDKKISIKELLKKCINQFCFFAKSRGIEINLEDNGSAIPDIWCDEEKIRIVFENIIHNAIKFSHNRKYVAVRIHYENMKDKVSVFVNNFGFGIPNDEKELIFEEFYRSAVKDPKRPIHGTGLGLSIAKNIVEAHNGIINIVSKREKREYRLYECPGGEGWLSFNTTVHVTLPIDPTN